LREDSEVTGYGLDGWDFILGTFLFVATSRLDMGAHPISNPAGTDRF
jgi:hypothetical protein